MRDEQARRGLRLALLSVVVATGALVSAQVPASDPYRQVAERYVRLVLAVGQHDADYVDAFYGPDAWKKEAEAAKTPLAAVDADAAQAEKELIGITFRPARDAEMWTLRRQYLARQLASLRSRVAMLQGTKMTFDEESKALYDAVAPVIPESEFQAVTTQLSARLPGTGSLIERYDAYKQGFVIPKNRLDRVFQEAIRGCRSRMPSAVDLACHEGYPGHHVYNALLEKHLVTDRGWIEYTVYPLFSPQSLIAEGTANYGIEVAFTPADRLRFESEVLFPLAGLDPAKVAEYYSVLSLVDRLSYAGNEAARLLIDGKIDRNGAIAWLEKYAMYTKPRAEQRLKFIDQYRSYVLNYNLGKDRVRAYVEKRMGRDKTPARRWQEFTALLSSPRLPSGLQ